MYKLFTKVSESNNSVIRPPGFDMVRRSYLRDLANTTRYYNDRVYSVKSNHLLCRLINNSSAPFQYDIDRYMEVILTRSPYVAKLYNFTSEIAFGKLHNGVFYGEGNQEILLYNEDYFNPYEALKDWRTVQAVKVLDHPFTDLNLGLLDGVESRSETGLCIFSINIPLLLVQYRGFIEEQYGKVQHEAESLLGVAHFVHMYVLPGITESHLEIAIANRLMNLFYGAPMGTCTKHLPFPVIHYEQQVDRCLTDILKNIENASMWYSAMLKNIPSICQVDGQAVVQMPDMAPTRQVWWALYLARLRMIQFLVEVGGHRGRAANGTLLNRMKIDIHRLLEENTLAMVLQDDLYHDIVETMMLLYKS